MKHIQNPRSPRILTAMAAISVLPFAPALAQEAVPSAAPVAAPVVVLPPPLVASAAAPVAAPPPAASATPVVQPVPEPSASPGAEAAATADTADAAAPAPARRAASARPSGRAVPAPAASPQAIPAPAAGIPAPAPAPIVAPVTSGAADRDAAPATSRQPAAVASGNSQDIILLAGGLLVGLLAMGTAGAMAMSLRRRRPAPETEWEGPLVDAAPVAAAPVPASVPASRAFGPPRAVPEGAGAQAIMDEGPIPTDPDARDVLVERMTAAPPDAANPFTTPRGRRRRARLMLNWRESELAAAGSARERQATMFDWRTYSSGTHPATRPATRPDTRAPLETTDA